MNKHRCPWAKDPLEIVYHDNEWGRETHEDQTLFEYLVLEGMQAGLSWSLVLKKRENFKRVFNNFDYNICANYTDEYLESLREDESIIRNKLKIYSVRKNAIAFIKVQKAFGSFDKYIWSFTNYKKINNKLTSYKDAPSESELSIKISKDLKKRGFNFVGDTIIYSYLQAIGMINDHEKGCFCYEECC